MSRKTYLVEGITTQRILRVITADSEKSALEAFQSGGMTLDVETRNDARRVVQELAVTPLYELPAHGTRQT